MPTPRLSRHIRAVPNPRARPAATAAAVDHNAVDKRAAIKETPMDPTAAAAAARRQQALRKYLVDAVKANAKARAKAKVRKASNNKGDLTADQIRPTRAVSASDIGAIADRIREEFDADILARAKKIQGLQEQRDALAKAAAESGAGRQAWANSSARVGLDTAIQAETLALGQLYGAARPDLLAALAEVQRRAAGGAVYPPVPNDRAALRSVADGTYASHAPDPKATMTSGQLNNLKKRLAKATSPHEAASLGEQATLLALRNAAEQQFGDRPPLGIRGRG
jgi:hypothetical protein